MNKKPSNTGEKQGKRKPIPPEAGMFKKGDPRINRKGRPRKSDALEKILTDKWDQPAIDGKGNRVVVGGKTMTYGDMVIERLFRESKLIPELLNRMYGKVKEDIEANHDVTLRVVYDKPPPVHKPELEYDGT